MFTIYNNITLRSVLANGIWKQMSNIPFIREMLFLCLKYMLDILCTQNYRLLLTNRNNFQLATFLISLFYDNKFPLIKHKLRI